MKALTKPPKMIALIDSQGRILAKHRVDSNGRNYYMTQDGWETLSHVSEQDLLDYLNKIRDTFEIVEE